QKNAPEGHQRLLANSPFIASLPTPKYEGVAGSFEAAVFDCAHGDECRANEVCNYGECVPALQGTPDSDKDTGEAQNNAVQNDTTENDTTENDITENDITENDTTSPHTSCLVDPFTATCDDPETQSNDQWSDALRLNRGKVRS
ncbi:MAG: hypothetical protein ACNA8W_14645, partial [Bradymonadaceae bacterium]